jgi:hypothetical protein
LLVDGDVAPGEGEVVRGGEEGDQAEGEAADGLGETEAVEAGPRRGSCWQFWRNRRLLAAGWRPGGAGVRGHGAGAVEGGGGSKGSMPPLRSIRSKPLLPLRNQPSPSVSWRTPSLRPRQEMCAIVPRKRLRDLAGLGLKHNRRSEAYKAFSFAGLLPWPPAVYIYSCSMKCVNEVCRSR